MWSKIPKKLKITLAVLVPLAFLAHYWISSYQEVSRQITALRDGYIEDKISAAYALSDMGFSAGSAVGELSNAVHDNNDQLRQAAIYALIRIDRGAAVDALSEAFGSRNSAVRLDAAEALERLNTKKAQKALLSYRSVTEKKYERASLGSWAEKFRKEMKYKKKQDYRRHKRLYGGLN